KKGAKFAFATLSDHTGSYEVTFFSETLFASRHLLESGSPLLLEVTARREEENVRMVVMSASCLTEELSKRYTNLEVHICSHQELTLLRDLLQSCPEGSCAITVFLTVKNHRLTLHLPKKYKILPEIKQEILK